ncbi:MAG: helix-turn-helix domain-containing protein, partial [Lachnospiraceae bacterium]|nr:helix-turn-helix domain-containing protein [Lachnospiraceae bacterium]
MKMQNRAKLAGILLKMERLRQNKGQKEVCLGICVPSYLSKIEHGTVCPDDRILAELFERLGIFYEEDEEILAGYQKAIEKYFYLMNYRLDTKTVYQELKAKEEKLQY